MMEGEGYVSAAQREFKAVVLCGRGDNLSPLTSPALPKALLPIGNEPIVENVLRLISEAHLRAVLLLAPKDEEGELSAFIRSRRDDTALALELQVYDPEQIHNTAQVMKWAYSQKHITTDVVVLPCDLCIQASGDASSTSNNPLSNLLDSHRLNQNLITSLYYERAASNEDKIKEGPPMILSMVETASSLLLDSKDLAEYDDEVEIRSSLFDFYPTALLTTALLPAHVYVCSLRALKILAALPDMDSFKEDFVPFLCKTQWQFGLLTKYTGDRTLNAKRHNQAIALSNSSTHAPIEILKETDANGQVVDSVRRPPLRTLLTRTSYEDLKGSRSDAIDILQDIKCGIRIWRKEDGFCARANFIEAIHEIHRVILPSLAAKQKAATHTSSKADPTEKAAPNRQISPDSVVKSNLVVGEKSTIKKSSIGKNVQIGKECKVSACIIMDGVVLGDGVKLDGCIICPHARIADDCNLTKCEVAFKCEIGANTTAKGEKLADLSD